MRNAETAHQQIKQAAIAYSWAIGNHPAAGASERDTFWVLRKAGREALNVSFSAPGDRTPGVVGAGTQNTWTNSHYGFNSGPGRLAKVLAYLAADDEEAHAIATTPPAPIEGAAR
jgi:hypothetical protein